MVFLPEGDTFRHEIPVFVLSYPSRQNLSVDGVFYGSGVGRVYEVIVGFCYLKDGLTEGVVDTPSLKFYRFLDRRLKRVFKVDRYTDKRTLEIKGRRVRGVSLVIFYMTPSTHVTDLGPGVSLPHVGGGEKTEKTTDFTATRSVSILSGDWVFYLRTTFTHTVSDHDERYKSRVTRHPCGHPSKDR